MLEVTITASDLVELSIPQLDDVVTFCWQAEWDYDLDLRNTIALVKERKQELMELAWSETSSRIWA